MEPELSVPRRRRSRMFFFLVVFPSILLTANLLACAAWFHFLGTPRPLIWGGATSLLTLSFSGTTVLSFRFSNFCLRQVYRIAAVWLGLLSYLVLASILAWVLAAVAGLLSLHVAPGLIGAICFGAALLVSLYGFVNAATLRVTPVTVKLANLPPSWHGREVALVTDLHLGNVRGAGFTRRVVVRLQKTGCKTIFIAGDLFDGSRAGLDALLEPWKEISGASQVYYVTGNHEEFSDREKYLAAVTRAGIRVLNNEMIDIDGLQLVGIHDREAHSETIFPALLQRAGLDRARAGILLLHQPINLAVSAQAGISLQLSGHTHGGQFWPWTKVAQRVHGRFVHGLNRFQAMQVYTSYGAGTWGAPLRVGTRSEIIQIRLESDRA